jgi:nicotinamidase-related amidase
MVGMRMTGQSALIVIDMQNAVLEAAWDRDGVVERTGALIQRARREGVPVVYVQHEIPAYPPMRQGADGWQIDARLAPCSGDRTIGKQFPDAFAGTVLADVLDAMDVTHLVIAGAETDACVTATIYRAMSEGWHVTLASDCHTTAWDDEGITAEQVVRFANEALSHLTYPGRGVEVVPHRIVEFSAVIMEGVA